MTQKLAKHGLIGLMNQLEKINPSKCYLLDHLKKEGQRNSEVNEEIRVGNHLQSKEEEL